MLLDPCLGDLDGADFGFGNVLLQIHMQQTIVQGCTVDFDALCEQKTALKLSRRNATVEKQLFRFIVAVAAPDHQLVVFDGNLQVIHGKSGNGKRDPQPVFTRLFDVVRRVAFGRRLGDTVKHPFQMIEAQQKWTVETGCPGHGGSPPDLSE